MASTYSTNLAIELIGTGDQDGTWGTTTNSNLGTLIEQAISGYVTQAISDVSDTTITIPNGATGVARNMFLELTGTLTAARNLIVPANKKLYFIYNNTTGGFAVTVKVSGQTGISVPNGKKVVLVSNGTDVVLANNYLVGDISGSAATLSATLAVNLGGTGTTTSTGTGSVVLSASPALTGTPTTGGNTIGYLLLPQSTNTTLALADSGKHLSVSSNVTIPANASVAFPTGTAVSIFNNSASSITISITTDTLRFAGTSNTGTRTLAPYGLVTVLKVASTVWVISGAGLS